MLDLGKLVRLSSRRTLVSLCKHSNFKMNRALRSNSTFDDRLGKCVVKKKAISNPFLPFLVGAPKLKLISCRECESMIYPEEEIRSCSINNCNVSYHSRCASDRFGISEYIKCPQHECFHCKKKTFLWRCSRCDLASHEKCAPYPEYVIRSKERPGEIICWRHCTDFPPIKSVVPASTIEEVFRRLPLQYVEKEFEIDPKWGNNPAEEPPSNVQPSYAISTMEELFRLLPVPMEEEFKIDLTTLADNLEPPSYVHIKRNIHLIKNKSYNEDISYGDCTCSNPNVCYDGCTCRSTLVSCSSVCKCSKNCTNRQFRKPKKVKVFMTQHCGWGVKANELIKEGEYIIEYVGEVIDDALCENRFWEMKGKGITKFYVVQVAKNFNIDAKFKGNESRFINHSCDPNCIMEKWEANGETRLGIYALKSIEPGEELTFKYKFQLYEHVDVKCRCGASNCRGYLGKKNGLPR